MRTLVLALLAALLAVPAPSFAAGRSCGLVTDPRGDTGRLVPSVENQLPNDDLDIVSADVGTDKRTVTVVVRTVAVSQVAPASPTGRVYGFRFTVGRDRYQMIAAITPDAVTSEVSRRGPGDFYNPIGNGTAVVDAAAREIRVSAPIGMFRTPLTTLATGSRLTGLEAFTSRRVGDGGVAVRLPVNRVASMGAWGEDLAADEATSTATYVAGTPSCVRIEG